MAETTGGMRYPNGEHHLASGQRQIPTGEGNEAKDYCPIQTAPTNTIEDGYNEEGSSDHHSKKSILGKVKDMAKKWRQMLSRKKQGHDRGNQTPPWGVSLDDDYEQDPEYHGAPMFASEMAPDSYLQTIPPSRSANNKESEMKEANDTLKDMKLHNIDTIKETTTVVALNRKTGLKDESTNFDCNNEICRHKRLSETLTEMIEPAYTVVSQASHVIASKIQGAGPGYEVGTKQVWDKRVSLKEYLMNKMEPGEDDEVLCQVETGSCTNGDQADEMVTMEMAKGAASSLPSQEETQEPPIPISTNPHTCIYALMN